VEQPQVSRDPRVQGIEKFEQSICKPPLVSDVHK